jgi:allantoin racemase
MKIWYEFPRPVTGEVPFYKMLKANWGKIGKSDSELVIKAPTKGTSEFKYSIVGHMYADMLRTIEMMEGIIQAEKEGYDAAVIGCFGDPGLDVLEALVDIPVTGPAKAAIMIAQALGTRMAFVTLLHWEKKIEKIISMYGVQNLTIPYQPCRPFNLPLEEFNDENRVIENFFEIAKGTIQDGADVIILACVNTSTLLTYKGISDVDGIPVVDGAIAALKVAEMLVDWKHAGLWRTKRTIPEDVKEGLRKGYYHGSTSV